MSRVQRVHSSARTLCSASSSSSFSVPSRFLSQPPVSHLRRLISATAGERRQVFTPSQPRAAATPADPSSSRVSTRGDRTGSGFQWFSGFSGFGNGTEYIEWEQSGTCRSWAAQQSDGGGARTCCPMMHRGHLEGVRREGRRFPAPPCDGETTSVPSGPINGAPAPEQEVGAPLARAESTLFDTASPNTSRCIVKKKLDLSHDKLGYERIFTSHKGNFSNFIVTC